MKGVIWEVRSIVSWEPCNFNGMDNAWLTMRN